MDESNIVNVSSKAVETPSDTMEINENPPTDSTLENEDYPADEPMEVDTDQTAEKSDAINAVEVKDSVKKTQSDELLDETNDKPSGDTDNNKKDVSDTCKTSETVSDETLSKTSDTTIPNKTGEDEEKNDLKGEVEKSLGNDPSIVEDVKDAIDMESSKDATENEICKITEFEQDIDVQDKKTDNEELIKEIKEDSIEKAEVLEANKGEAVDQMESIENVQKYIDETSQEELEKDTANIESISGEDNANKVTNTQGSSNTTVKLHKEPNKDTKILDEKSDKNLENVLDSSADTPGDDGVHSKPFSVPEQSATTNPESNEPMSNDNIDAVDEDVPRTSDDTAKQTLPITEELTDSIQDASSDDRLTNRDSNVLKSDAHSQESDAHSQESDAHSQESDAHSQESDTHMLKSDTHVKHDTHKRRAYVRRRHDPVDPGAPLSLSKLYYHGDTEFKGFLAEYYDSTIFMYRAYWSYIREEFDLMRRPLPKYKTNFYTEPAGAAPTMPLVQTSSGRIVKKKEMREFTPSVPSSHQLKREREPVATPKKESPVAKKEKKDPEESSRQRYRVPLEKFGWKREVVFRRGHGDSKHSADVYYYSPGGKKLRSIREILDHLPENDTLRPFHFTFVRELLGYGSPLEVSREAVSRTLTSEDDTPKRVKTGSGATRKVFSASLAAKTDPIKVLNGKAKKLPLSSSSMKRSHDQVDSSSDDSRGSTTPDDSSPTKHTHKEERSKPSNGEVKSKPLSSLLEKKLSSDVKHRKSSSGAKTPSTGSKRRELTQSENKVPNALASRLKADSGVKLPSTKKRKLDISTVAPFKPSDAQVPVRKVVHSNKNLVNEVSNQFNAVVHLCKYLRVEDLLRVARVNRMFNAAAHCHMLWTVVKLKNSKIRDWDGLADCLIRHGSHTLDMLKMIGSTDPDENDEIWNRFYKVIGKIHSLKRLELGRVTAAEILNAASNCSKNLTEFSVIAQKLATIDLKLFQGLPNLEILQLRSFESKREHGLIMMNIPMLAHMRNLRHLSLTGVKNLKSYQVNVFKDFPPLASLELGDCTKLDDRFPESSLSHMTSLVRLRLEMVQGNMANKFVEVIATLPRLRTLELINIDTKKGFDEMFGRLSRVEHLLIFPTYITQSSTTNWLVLSGLARLKSSLKFLTWGLTQELLRVTTLFIEQWNAQLNLDEGVSKLDPEELKKTIVESNSIPVMKPLPELFEKVHFSGKSHGSSKQNISELDILPIDELKTMLEKVLCDTKIKLITVPVSSTTRIYLPSN